MNNTGSMTTSAWAARSLGFDGAEAGEREGVGASGSWRRKGEHGDPESNGRSSGKRSPQADLITHGPHEDFS